MIIDTHIHLDDSRYDNDLDDVIQRAYQGDVKRFIIPGADPSTLEKAIHIAHQYEDVYFGVGVHPYDKDALKEYDLTHYITDHKCVAVGECGLDYFRLEGTPEQKEEEKKVQKEVFIQQINLAKQYDKPLIVHIRDASHDAKEILLQHADEKLRGVLHCFNADEQLLALADHQFYFGIGGVVTFKNAKKLIQVLPKIPLERMIIETDGPYLTPTPHRGERNEPVYTNFVVEKIAQILEQDVEYIKQITTENAMKLFNIN